MQFGTYRYPGGTTANYWNWKLACETGSNSCGKNNNTIAAFASSERPECRVAIAPAAHFTSLVTAVVSAAGVEAVIVVNMLTDTLASQLEFLASIAAAGIAVTRVELGNGE